MNPTPCEHCDHDCRAAHRLAGELADTTRRALSELAERVYKLERHVTGRGAIDKTLDARADGPERKEIG